MMTVRKGWRCVSGALCALLLTAQAQGIGDPDVVADQVAARGGRRVGELDEEMVHESSPGDIITLGTSSWRIRQTSIPPSPRRPSGAIPASSSASRRA